jgi:hypothetical protein
MSVDFSLSMSDLVLIKEFAEAFGKDDKETIKKILFENGMDTNQEIDEVVCTHRNLQGKVVHCVRYESVERSDPEWLKNPACSWENKVNACDDPHLRIQLGAMGKQANFTGSLIDHMKKHSKVKEDI